MVERQLEAAQRENAQLRDKLSPIPPSTAMQVQRSPNKASASPPRCQSLPTISVVAGSAAARNIIHSPTSSPQHHKQLSMTDVSVETEETNAAERDPADTDALLDELQATFIRFHRFVDAIERSQMMPPEAAALLQRDSRADRK